MKVNIVSYGTNYQHVLPDKFLQEPNIASVTF